MDGSGRLAGLVAALIAALAGGGCSDRLTQQVGEQGSVACADRADNDGDQLIDCDDPDCQGESVCAGTLDGQVRPPIPDGGAADGWPPSPDQGLPSEQVHYFAAGDEVGDVDLLFVIDSSGSMGEEQVNLASNFPGLIEALRSQSLANDLPNLHIGVISSDLGAGNYTSLPSCEQVGGDKGKLQAQPRVAGCTPPNGDWITYLQGQTNVPDPATRAGVDAITRVKQGFSCIARLGTGGCGFENTLESARRALDPNANVNPGFLRPGAVLAVVFITDEDDCSARNLQLYDPTQSALTDPLGPLTSFRCFEFGVVCDVNDRNKVGPRHNCVPAGDWLWDVKTRYLDFFRGLKPPGRVVLAAIAGPTVPVEVGKDGNNPVLKQSCQSAAGIAVPAIRLKAVIDAMGANGVFSSICAASFRPALEQVADRVQAARGLNCLAPLADKDPAAGLQPNCVVSEVLGSAKTPLPACVASAGCDPCPCWRVIEQPDCSTGFALAVQRQGASAPGTLFEARCEGL